MLGDKCLVCLHSFESLKGHNLTEFSAEIGGRLEKLCILSEVFAILNIRYCCLVTQRKDKVKKNVEINIEAKKLLKVQNLLKVTISLIQADCERKKYNYTEHECIDI